MKKDENKVTDGKKVVYHVFTRLFGNTNTTNKPWGTIEENGVGKFNDFTPKALREIKKLGVTHIWFTGVPHHALINDYTDIGISNDHPSVVKGRAGSPYAVKDYYNVNPDLAVNPANRLQEFEALIARTHKAGMKVIIDIVPNHVARKYEGKTNPVGVTDFGANDDTSVAYDVNNNFYYIPNTSFEMPDIIPPLGGAANALLEEPFVEMPAKWTGNGSRMARPDKNDWYETAKINYGVRPDGQVDFPYLPWGYDTESYEKHFEFWQDKVVPDSWYKFRDIALYWIEKGVDGFRYDMAELVPFEFWSFMNSAIKMKRPDAFLLAEVYNPDLYYNYIKMGKMDYLYDKVGTYDKLKDVIQGRSWPDELTQIQYDLWDVSHHMLKFLDNHDEQRIASPEFAGDPEKGKPMMVVSATISSAPVMIYFGQEVGEAANEDAGFGTHSRTSIFDYIGVPSHQRWVNDGKFDGGQLTPSEAVLRDFYKRLLNFTLESTALMGDFQEIQFANRYLTEGYDTNIYSFTRWSENQKLIIISNFSSDTTSSFTLKVPKLVIEKWNLADGKYKVVDQLYKKIKWILQVTDGEGSIPMQLLPLESVILELKYL